MDGSGTPMTTANQIANPAVLGLFGFGMTTLLLAMNKLDLIPLNSVIFSMGLLYGGAAQMIAGLFEYKKNNLFGATAFTSFGFLWIILMVIDTNVLNSAADADSMVAFLVLWGIIVTIFFIASLARSPRSMQITVLAVAILFFVLAAGTAFSSDIVVKIAGAIGILAGAAAIYIAAGQLINEEFGKKLVPL